MIKPLSAPVANYLKSTLYYSDSCTSGLRRKNSHVEAYEDKPVGKIKKGCWVLKTKYGEVSVPRIIWLLCKGEDPKNRSVDYINRTTKANRIENLQLGRHWKQHEFEYDDRLELPSVNYLKYHFDYNPDSGRITKLTTTGQTGIKGNFADASIHNGYRKVSINGELYSAHRIAWKLYYGTEPPHVIDHINECPRDNRIANLQELTTQENIEKHHLLEKGYLGSVAPQGNRWVAQVKGTHKGMFSTREEAVEALKRYRADPDGYRKPVRTPGSIHQQYNGRWRLKFSKRKTHWVVGNYATKEEACEMRDAVLFLDQG